MLTLCLSWMWSLCCPPQDHAVLCPLRPSPGSCGMGQSIPLLSVNFSYVDSSCSGLFPPIYSNLIGKKVIPRTLIKYCHFRSESVMVMMSFGDLEKQHFFKIYEVSLPSWSLGVISVKWVSPGNIFGRERAGQPAHRWLKQQYFSLTK